MVGPPNHRDAVRPTIRPSADGWSGNGRAASRPTIGHRRPPPGEPLFGVPGTSAGTLGGPADPPALLTLSTLPLPLGLGTEPPLLVPAHPLGLLAVDSATAGSSPS
jgi:hypothetical protein